MLDADSVTDEEIRELMASNARALRGLARDDAQTNFDLRVQNLYCEIALDSSCPDDMRATARGECAKAIGLRLEMTTGTCATCGDRIAKDGTCSHIRALLSAGAMP